MVQNLLKKLAADGFSLQVSGSRLLCSPKPDIKTAALIKLHKFSLMQALGHQAGEMVEAECMRIIPMLCQKAEESPELRPEISAIIDEFLELERAGNESALLVSLKQAESRFTG